MRYRFWSVTLVLVLLAVGPTVGRGAEPQFRSFNGSQTTNLDCSIKARLFPDINIAFFTEGFSTQDGSENSIRCTARVRDGGQGRKGVGVRLDGEIVPLDDVNDTIFFLPTRSGRTDRDGNLEIEFPLDDLPDEDLAVIIEGGFSTKKMMDYAQVECSSINRMPCQAGPETLCLLDDERFKVEVAWRTSTSSGAGMVLDARADRGAFFLLEPGLPEIVIQLLDKCSQNDHFWVLLDPFTSAEYDVTVTDTLTGSSRVYHNDLGQPAEAVTDTSAFATCP